MRSNWKAKAVKVSFPTATFADVPKAFDATYGCPRETPQENERIFVAWNALARNSP
jgi:hypothetical protein